MEKLNSYLGMAKNDYLYAKNAMTISKEIGNYNGVAAFDDENGNAISK